MESRKVQSVLLPYTRGVGLDPVVGPDDKLTYAVQVMVSHGISRIAVLRNGNPVGIIRLDEALEKLGL